MSSPLPALPFTSGMPLSPPPTVHLVMTGRAGQAAERVSVRAAGCRLPDKHTRGQGGGGGADDVHLPCPALPSPPSALPNSGVQQEGAAQPAGPLAQGARDAGGVPGHVGGARRARAPPRLRHPVSMHAYPIPPPPCPQCSPLPSPSTDTPPPRPPNAAPPSGHSRMPLQLSSTLSCTISRLHSPTRHAHLHYRAHQAPLTSVLGSGSASGCTRTER